MGNLGAIDYLACSGPNQFAKDKWGTPFGRNRGVFLTFKGDPTNSTTYPIPRIRRQKIRDGSSNTLMVIECTGQGWFIDKDLGLDGHGVWANGQNIGTVGGVQDPENPGESLNVPPINMRSSSMSPPELLAWGNEEPRSDHPGGVNALMCDGSTRFWSDDIPQDVLLAFATRNGNEPVDQGHLD
jgi:prepilin-type processing-associated H-X9-DG protein